jgi:hypothetical protein
VPNPNRRAANIKLQAAAILDIPYKEVMQAALIPVAYTIGTDFRPALREPIQKVMHWDRW